MVAAHLHQKLHWDYFYAVGDRARVDLCHLSLCRALVDFADGGPGVDEEVAALSLGASGWRTFRKVTLPNVKWALLYGVILCTARVFGEFGAVSVVSGHIDSNDTMPLRIEKLWNEYNNQAAFSVASLLAFLAVVTLIVQTIVERQYRPGRHRRR